MISIVPTSVSSRRGYPRSAETRRPDRSTQPTLPYGFGVGEGKPTITQ